MMQRGADDVKGGQFVHNLLLFGRVLHGLGLDVNLGRMMDLAAALGHIEVGRRTDFYHATRSLLVHRREDLPLFDEAFNLFWRPPREGREGMIPTGRTRRRKPPRAVPPPLGAQEPPPEDPNTNQGQNAEPILEVTKTYSAAEALRRKDFALLTPDEYAAIKALMAELTWALGERRTRRHLAAVGKTDPVAAGQGRAGIAGRFRIVERRLTRLLVPNNKLSRSCAGSERFAP